MEVLAIPIDHPHFYKHHALKENPTYKFLDDIQIARIELNE